LQGAAAIKTDSSESRELLDDLGTVHWTRASVRSTSPSAFADSTYHAPYSSKVACASISAQETESKDGYSIEEEEVLNFSVTHKASATISSILARVNAKTRARGGNVADAHDHAKSGQVRWHSVVWCVLVCGLCCVV
jgi:hypothetical protein